MGAVNVILTFVRCDIDGLVALGFTAGAAVNGEAL